MLIWSDQFNHSLPRQLFLPAKRYMMQNLLLAVLILLIPSNLFLKFGLEQSYVNGLQIDYLLPKLFATDIIVLLLLTIALIRSLAKHSLKNIGQRLSANLRQNWLALTIWLLILAYQFTTNFVIAGTYFWLKLTLMGLLFIYLRKKQLRNLSLLISISFSLLIQTTLGIYQFLLQQPLFPYHILGEPNFRPYYRLSRQFLLGRERILAYGTTAHPNVLAGFGAIFCLILWQSFSKSNFKPNWQKILQGLSLTASLILIFITQSWTALLTLVLGLLLMFYKKISNNFKKISTKSLAIALPSVVLAVPLLVAISAYYFPHNPSWQRRSHLNQAGITLFSKQPWLGTGLNQFAGRVEQDKLTKDVVGFVQPVHHVGILWLTETGVLGLLLMAIVIAKNRRKKELLYSLLVISPLLVLDHYLYTLQTGQLLLVLWLSQSLRDSN